MGSKQTTNADPAHWSRIAQSAPFRSLVVRRRRVVFVFATAAVGLVGALAVLSGWATDAMDTPLGVGWNVGIVLAVGQIVLVWLLGFAYLRYSERTLDPLRSQVIDQAAAEESSRPVTTEGGAR